MIVTHARCPDGGADRLRVVTQTDHAFLAAEMLALWRGDGLPQHPRRDELLFAAREHDNGWRESDAAPRIDASGAPHGFRTLPDEARVELWRRGIERHAGTHPYASALIAHHAVEVYRHRVSTDSWRREVERWGERRDELLEAFAEDHEAAGDFEHDYRFIHLTDALSLGACEAWDQEATIDGVAVQFRPRDGWSAERAVEIALDPFPLAGATTFRVDCRLIDERRYAGDADLGVALASAARRPLHVRLVERVGDASLQ